MSDGGKWVTHSDGPGYTWEEWEPEEEDDSELEDWPNPDYGMPMGDEENEEGDDDD
jgi:hypothetical protein